MYVQELNNKLKLLDNFNALVDYALQMNIQDVSKLNGQFTLASITEYVLHHFNTIVEFNPSFLRTGKDRIINDTLSAWNTMLEDQITESNVDKITFTMANDYHAGFNEITYNFHDNDLYMCPFIYENVFDKNIEFKITKSGDQYQWNDIIEHDAFVKNKQFKYLKETTECSTCPYQMSCISKHVLFYMEQYDIKDCVISKKVVDLCQ